jgi:hypothetical protein
MQNEDIIRVDEYKGLKQLRQVVFFYFLIRLKLFDIIQKTA